ncbi:hypothetical protein ACOMHN_034854 [Nucella lapillus]
MNPALPLRLHQLHHRIHEHEQQHQAAGVERRRRRRKVRRTVWVRNWLTEARRRELSHYYNLLQIIHDDDADPWTFKNYTRVTPEIFLEILDRIRSRITKEDTVMRLAIKPGLKLAVALRYMATEDSYGSLAYAFRVGFSTVSMFVPQVCQAIFVEFEHDTFDARWSRDAWLAIAEKFEKRWNMPHVMGALDGKHVAIRKPKGSGSLYHNYKGFFSIPMLALVDADYKFVWVELGGMGHMSDSQIFLQTGLRDALEDGSVLRPDPCPLTGDPEDTTPVPYYIVADDAFALRDFCMKPYSKRNMNTRELIFNYRLCRARRVVENAFGLLANRFRVLLRTMELDTKNVRTVIKSCVVLHNLLLERVPPQANHVDREEPATGTLVPGSWRDQVIWEQPEQPPARGANHHGKRVREILADYFGSARGIVPWQWDKANINERD